jgi:hypothetical protein
MKTYIPFLSAIIPIYMFSSARYLAVGYFVGAYATFIYDHKPMYEFTKPYVEPVRMEMIKVTNVFKRLYDDQTRKEDAIAEKPKTTNIVPNLPSWFRNPFG